MSASIGETDDSDFRMETTKVPMSSSSTVTPSSPPPSQLSESAAGVVLRDSMENENGGGGGGGVDLSSPQTNGNGVMQSASSPQHSYRHSRAYRHFKNPPQPHMCIRTTTQAGEELFINVLSWTRIVIPQQPSDPIPLYGGMKVPPGSPRCPPLVYAVMANPEVLKDSGRHSKDPEDRGAMVELMCDFVEAMNPDVKLTRNALILKDRDISGELKDVWNAVQAQRDREREEQILQQRQQQHYHNITTQQMFPKNEPHTQTDAAANDTDNKVLYADYGPDATDSAEESSNQQVPAPLPQQQLCGEAPSAINRLNDNPAGADGCVAEAAATDASSKQPQPISSASNQVNNSTDNSTAITATAISQPAESEQVSAPVSGKPTTANSAPSSNQQPAAAPAPAPAPAPATPTKKEKLGGFLPNGCIFPRFKNNKHKDKEKDKESKSSKDKEKTLLNSLIGSKRDKHDATNESSNGGVGAATPKSQYDKNFINHLESEVEKLDLNKIDSSSNSDNMLIKLKVASSAGGK